MGHLCFQPGIKWNSWKYLVDQLFLVGTKKTCLFDHFWPLGGLKDPLEVQVQHETYRSMSGTYVQAILSQKNWTGLAGALRNGRNQSKYDFCSVGWPLLVNYTFFSIFGPNWSKSLRNGSKWSKSGVWQFFTIWDHFWMIWTNLDQKQKKCFFCPK